LGAALMQSDPTDDPIIIEHVRAAHALALGRHRADRLAAARSRSASPSIMPDEPDDTVYLVLDDFGRRGRAWREADLKRCDRQSVVSDLIAGEYSNPVSVVAFNLGQQWAKDASREIARDVRRRSDLAGGELPPWTATFVEGHIGNERQLALRLVG
jgi:hypothetical protein